ncbi:MAG: type I restriction endonuclease subunit R [Planctomycetes bacterium]|nr:type I restriction endonuclease subunit R [Planctomycetota bacterium]
MTTQDWNEITLSEDPAIELLKELGYTYVPAEQADSEREGLKGFVLVPRLAKKLKEINPLLSDENLKKAVRVITTVSAVSLIEANEQVYTSIVHGVALEEDRGDGKKSYDVSFIDFERPEKNEFVVTRQFMAAGAKGSIKCDIVLFVNGIPLVVIECKSPTIQEPISKAIEQLFRYQELKDEYKDRGAPKLFETVQILIAACGQSAKFATVGTPHRHFLEWKNPYPITLDELNAKYTGRLSGKTPTPQDVLIYGLLRPDNLLDIVRNFIAFEAEGGKTIKKISRYQQFIAVNNAIERIRKSKDYSKRGGIIWHTQGSGKSLSMLWLAVKLRRMSHLENPIIVVVTDRIDLDNQIVGTFQRCGFPNPNQAKSVKDLKNLLSQGNGLTVLTTIQKFQELAEDEHLSEAKNIFVLVDEAHRTQYKNLAANMRQAMPNACFLGFTGTPIDKKDRSTIQTFGPYIHTYTIEQAIRDGATVPIFYESRLPDVHVQGDSLDAIFDRYFQEYNEKEREEIKRKYATEEIIGLASSRIEAICMDIIEHYEKFIMPNGFKAQIVTPSREAAVSYKETLDRLNAPVSAVLISGGHNDPQRLAKHHKSQSEEKEIIRSYKEDPMDKLAIIVVCDKLLTGFDAPVEQVMYVDSPLKEHTLLQAIARVNRTADKKDYGLVVDYWGISRDLQEALGVFQTADITGVLLPKTDELPRLEARYRAVMRFFDSINKSDIEACLKILEPEDVRADFDSAFRRFSQSMDMVLPDPAALRYSADLRWLGKVRNAAKTRFRDTTLDLSACGAKVRQLIEEHIRTNGVKKLLEPVSIFSKKFDEVVDTLTSPEAKASEIEHAVRYEIHVRQDEDPVFYQSLKERLEKIIEERKKERLGAVEELKHLQALVDEMRNVGKAAQELGFSESEHALYKILSESKTGQGTDAHIIREPLVEYGKKKDAYMELTHSLMEALEKQKVIDWIHKDDVQREMRKQIKGILRAKGYRFDEMEVLTTRIMDLARARLTR